MGNRGPGQIGLVRDVHHPASAAFSPEHGQQKMLSGFVAQGDEQLPAALYALFQTAHILWSIVHDLTSRPVVHGAAFVCRGYTMNTLRILLYHIFILRCRLERKSIGLGFPKKYFYFTIPENQSK